MDAEIDKNQRPAAQEPAVSKLSDAPLVTQSAREGLEYIVSRYMDSIPIGGALPTDTLEDTRRSPLAPLYDAAISERKEQLDKLRETFQKLLTAPDGTPLQGDALNAKVGDLLGKLDLRQLETMVDALKDDPNISSDTLAQIRQALHTGNRADGIAALAPIVAGRLESSDDLMYRLSRELVRAEGVAPEILGELAGGVDRVTDANVRVLRLARQIFLGEEIAVLGDPLRAVLGDPYLTFDPLASLTRTNESDAMSPMARAMRYFEDSRDESLLKSGSEALATVLVVAEAYAKQIHQEQEAQTKREEQHRKEQHEQWQRIKAFVASHPELARGPYASQLVEGPFNPALTEGELAAHVSVVHAAQQEEARDAVELAQMIAAGRKRSQAA